MPRRKCAPDLPLDVFLLLSGSDRSIYIEYAGLSVRVRLEDYIANAVCMIKDWDGPSVKAHTLSVLERGRSDLNGESDRRGARSVLLRIGSSDAVVGRPKFVLSIGGKSRGKEGGGGTPACEGHHRWTDR